MLTAVMIQEQWEPVIPPGEVSFWPPQPGWYVLLVLVGVVVLYIGIRAAKRYKTNKYRRLAVAELEQMRQAPPDPAALNRILKAVAIRTFGRERVAALHGENWRSFLSATSPRSKLGAILQSSVEDEYGHQTIANNNQPHWAAMIDASKDWIRTHKNK